MKFKIIAPLAALSLLVFKPVFAETGYLTNVISRPQIEEIVKTFLKIAPKGTTASIIDYFGYYNLANGYLSSFDIQYFRMKVTAKLWFIPVASSNVTVQLAGVLPTLNCNQPIATVANVYGTNERIDSEIRDYVQSHSTEILRDNFIKQTGLGNLCFPLYE